MIAQQFTAPDVEWFHLAPVLVLVAGALVLLVVGALTPPWPKGAYGLSAAVTAATAGIVALVQWGEATGDGADAGPSTLVAGALAFDAFAVFVTVVICGATVLVALVCGDDMAEQRRGPEVHALLLVAAAGAVVMSAANDLIVLFLGLETLSLALYVLAASDRRRTASQESGLKYFILGGFASALLLYGIALVYGGTRTTNISDIVGALRDTVLADGNDAVLLAGIALLLVGLGFKVAAVPFHSWAPDVYQGAPNPVTGFMASVGKAAAFAALVRVLVVAFPAYRDDWRPAVWTLAVLSLVVGSVVAVVQGDVKRMLAYSSISHAGFILVGIEAAGHTAGSGAGDGVTGVVSYLALYSVLTVGSFAVVDVVSTTAGGADASLDAFAGLGRRRPLLAVALTVFLLAQAGVPFTAGFVAKWGVVQAAVDVESYALAIIAMVSAVVAAYVYLRIMIKTWLEPGPDGAPREAVAFGPGVAIGLAAVFTIAVGVWPDWILDAADQVTVFAR